MLTDIPSLALKQLVRLSERKEALMAQIQEIDREMIRVQNKFGIPSRQGDQRAPVTVSRAPGGPLRRRSKRGALKEKIVRALLAKGANPSKTDFTGRDAVGWASDSRRPLVIQALQRAAATKH